jgi:P27 family predicted phage terminase small subunit
LETNMATQKLKLVNPLSAVPSPEALAADADLGGVGLDWRDPPATLDPLAVTVWTRLRDTFAADEVPRFREADREALGAYCEAVAMHARAAQALATDGVLVTGRSKDDAGRMVRNPAWGQYRDASNLIRHWGNELGLTPSARRRIGMPDGSARQDEDNPFMPG